MPEIDEIPKTYGDAVKTLVRWHAEGGPADLLIYTFDDPCEETVRLVELSDEFIANDELRPLALGRSEMFPFKSAVALATHEQWRGVESRRLALPKGWDLSTKRQVWP